MYGAMPTRSRYFIAMASASSRLRFKTDTWPVMQLLSAVMLLNRLKLWNTMPTLALYCERFMSCPVISLP